MNDIKYWHNASLLRKGFYWGLVLFRTLKIPARCQNTIFKKLKIRLFKKMPLRKYRMNTGQSLIELIKY